LLAQQAAERRGRALVGCGEDAQALGIAGGAIPNLGCRFEWLLEEELDRNLPTSHGSGYERAAVPATLQVVALTRVIQRRNHRPRLREPDGIYFVTWSLARGTPTLTAEERTVVAACLRHFADVRYRLYAWVVMDDHVHVVVAPLESLTLDSIVHSWRSFVAHALVPKGRRAPMWRRDQHDRILRADGELAEKVGYVAANPWRRWPEVDSYPWVFPQPEP